MPTQSIKESSCTQPLESSTRKSGRMARVATAAVLAGLLAFPGNAFAAEWVDVGSDHYDTAASGAGSEGGAWSWDGANDMVLDNYNGDSIGAGGDLNIDLVGDNVVTAGESYSGIAVSGSDSENPSDLVISGEGSLSVESDGYGIAGSNASVTIEDTNVSVNAGACGIDTYNGDIVIRNSNVTAESNHGWGAIDAGYNESGAAIIENSVVNASNGSGYYAIGGGASSVNDSNGVGVSITNSVVNASIESGDHAIYSRGEMELSNSDIDANVGQSDEISALAEAGGSQGAAIAALGDITLDNVNLYGAEKYYDESAGKYYVGAADGSAMSAVSLKHTDDSKFVQGVGRTQTAATGGSISDGSSNLSSVGNVGTSRLASTGGGIGKMVAEAATAITSDPTCFATSVATLVGGIGFVISGAISKRRSE